MAADGTPYRVSSPFNAGRRKLTNDRCKGNSNPSGCIAHNANISMKAFFSLVAPSQTSEHSHERGFRSRRQSFHVSTLGLTGVRCAVLVILCNRASTLTWPYPNLFHPCLSPPQRHPLSRFGATKSSALAPGGATMGK